MKKIKYSLISLSSLILLVACDADDEVAEDDAAKISQLEETVAASQVKIEALESTVAKNNELIENRSAEFSYLSELAEADLEAYNTFLEDYDTKVLENYSPENILLLYFHSVVMSDWEAIYELTYDGGGLPDRDEFNEVFYTAYNTQSMLESALDYRYYDTLEARSDTQSEDDVSVEISVAIGISRFSTVYGLKRENDIWKMDVLYLLEDDS